VHLSDLRRPVVLLISSTALTHSEEKVVVIRLIELMAAMMDFKLAVGATSISIIQRTTNELLRL